MSSDDIMKQIEAHIAKPMPRDVAIEFLDHLIMQLQMRRAGLKSMADKGASPPSASPPSARNAITSTSSTTGKKRK